GPAHRTSGTADRPLFVRPHHFGLDRIARSGPRTSASFDVSFTPIGQGGISREVASFSRRTLPRVRGVIQIHSTPFDTPIASHFRLCTFGQTPQHRLFVSRRGRSESGHRGRGALQGRAPVRTVTAADPHP